MAKPAKETDPSFIFGQNEGLFAYRMATTIGGDSNRTVRQTAEDAVRAARHKFERPDVDTELAINGLITILDLEALGAHINEPDFGNET